METNKQYLLLHIPTGYLYNRKTNNLNGGFVYRFNDSHNPKIFPSLDEAKYELEGVKQAVCNACEYEGNSDTYITIEEFEIIEYTSNV